MSAAPQNPDDNESQIQMSPQKLTDEDAVSQSSQYSSDDDISSTMSDEDAPSLSSLPNEIIHATFRYLPPLDFIRAGATCRHWYNLSETSLDIWIDHCYQLWHDKQVISRSRREIEEGFKRMFAKNAETGKYESNKGSEASSTSQQKKERLPIKTLKYLLDKFKVDYSDCFTRPALESRYEEYLRKQQKKEIKVVDPLFLECDKPKYVYFKSLRQAKSLHIPIHILCSYQWVCHVNLGHNDPYGIDGLTPEFRENFVYYANGSMSPLTWTVQDLGKAIQLAQYPKLVVSRREVDWAFLLKNDYVTLTSISPHKRVDATIPLNIHELMRAATEAKNEGNRYFEEGEIHAAIMEYRTIFHFLARAIPPAQSETATPEDNINAKLIADNLQKLKIATYSNLSACYLALEEWRHTKAYADKALSFDPHNVKVLYRRGRANFELGNIVEAQKDLEEANLLSRHTNPNVKLYLSKCNRRLNLEDTSNAKFSYSNLRADSGDE